VFSRPVPSACPQRPVPAVWRERGFFGGGGWAWVSLASLVSGDGYLGAKTAFIRIGGGVAPKKLLRQRKKPFWGGSR